MFSDIGIFYEYSVPSLVYIGFRMFLRWDMFANSTTKYLDVLKVLPDFCPSFFRDDDCLICCTSYW